MYQVTVGVSGKNGFIIYQWVFQVTVGVSGNTEFIT